jgi:hypothetical protein
MRPQWKQTDALDSSGAPHDEHSGLAGGERSIPAHEYPSHRGSCAESLPEVLPGRAILSRSRSTVPFEGKQQGRVDRELTAEARSLASRVRGVLGVPGKPADWGPHHGSFHVRLERTLCLISS